MLNIPEAEVAEGGDTSELPEQSNLQHQSEDNTNGYENIDDPFEASEINLVNPAREKIDLEGIKRKMIAQ